MKAAKKRWAQVARPRVLVGSLLAEAGRMLTADKSQTRMARMLRVTRATLQRAYFDASDKR